MKSLSWWGVTAATGLIMSACLWGGAKAEDAQLVAETYMTDLRWGRYTEAAGAVHPDLRPAFRRVLERGEDRLRITEFELDAVRILADGKTAEAVTRLRLYKVPSLLEEPREQVLRLRFDLGRWYVEPDLAALARDVGSGPRN